MPEVPLNNEEFKDLVHVVGNFSGPEKKLWKIIKDIKSTDTKKLLNQTKYRPKFSKLLKKIKNKLNKQSLLSSVNADNRPSDDLLNMAGKMFIYLKTNPRSEWVNIINLIKNFFDKKENKFSPRTLLNRLSNLKPQGNRHIGENIKKIFFETLASVDDFIFDKVDDLTSLEDIGPDLTTELKGVNLYYTHKQA